MNQDMHTWIAIVLSVLTVKLIVHWHRFSEHELPWLMFIIDMIVTFTLFGIWLYQIS